MKIYLRLLGFLFTFFAGSVSVFAYSFPFREFSEGDPVPEVTLYAQEDQSAITFSQLKNSPFIAVFWGADLPAKLEHAAKTLQEIESLSTFLSQRDIQRISVNAQGDSPDIIQNVISRSQSTLPVYLDHGKNAYGTLGIFVMPAILLVDENGKVTAGMGYSHDMVDRLKGAVEIMLGEKTLEKVQAELHPEMKIKSHEEMAANQHLNYGRVMLEKGSEETALREFLIALELNENLSQAHIELACLYIKRDHLDKAAKELRTGLSGDPDSLRGHICQAKLKMKNGYLDEAEEDFKSIQKKAPSAPEAYYLLGNLYEAQNMPIKASSEYKHAYLLLKTHVDGREQ